jgi:uncharacterized protein DUF2510
MTSGQAGERQLPEPGWYPDPARRFELRWWDGRAWSEHVVRPGRQGSDRPPRPPGTPTPRGWLPLAGVVVVLLTVVLGSRLPEAVLDEPVAAPVEVGSGVRVHPLSGWRAGQPEDGRVLLTRGSGNLAVVTVPGSPDARRLAALYLERELTPAVRGPLRTQPPESVRLGSGADAVRFAYEGEFADAERTTHLQGEVTALIGSGGVGVVFDAWSLPDVFRYERDDVARMIDTAEVG